MSPCWATTEAFRCLVRTPHRRRDLSQRTLPRNFPHRGSWDGLSILSWKRVFDRVGANIRLRSSLQSSAARPTASPTVSAVGIPLPSPHLFRAGYLATRWNALQKSRSDRAQRCALKMIAISGIESEACSCCWYSKPCSEPPHGELRRSFVESVGMGSWATGK